MLAARDTVVKKQIKSSAPEDLYNLEGKRDDKQNEETEGCDMIGSSL